MQGYYNGSFQNTYKGRQYPYYCCSRKLKEGRLSCSGFRMPTGTLDDIVIGEVAKQVLERTQLTEILEAFIKASAERDGETKERLSRLRHAHTKAKAGISDGSEFTLKLRLDERRQKKSSTSRSRWRRLSLSS